MWPGIGGGVALLHVSVVSPSFGGHLRMSVLFCSCKNSHLEVVQRSKSSVWWVSVAK